MTWEILSLSRMQKMLKCTDRNVCVRDKTESVSVPLADILEKPESKDSIKGSLERL